MRSGLLIGLTLSAAALASVAFSDDVPAGQAAFLENKCNTCHSVDSAGIAKKSKKMKGRDLSDVGNRIESTEWLNGFLLKEQEKDGNKHKKTWKGTDEELDAIIEWIAGLKKS